MIFKVKSKSGLTLVEVIVSVFILGTALCFVLATFVVGRMGLARGKHRIEARNILRAKMETLKNTPYDNILSSGPHSVPIDPGADLIENTGDDLIGQESVYVVDKNGYKRIKMSVFITILDFTVADNDLQNKNEKIRVKLPRLEK